MALADFPYGLGEIVENFCKQLMAEKVKTKVQSKRRRRVKQAIPTKLKKICNVRLLSVLNVDGFGREFSEVITW